MRFRILFIFSVGVFGILFMYFCSFWKVGDRVDFVEFGEGEGRVVGEGVVFWDFGAI